MELQRYQRLRLKWTRWVIIELWHIGMFTPLAEWRSWRWRVAVAASQRNGLEFSHLSNESGFKINFNLCWFSSKNIHFHNFQHQTHAFKHNAHRMTVYLGISNKLIPQMYNNKALISNKLKFWKKREKRSVTVASTVENISTFGHRLWNTPCAHAGNNKWQIKPKMLRTSKNYHL